MRIRSAYTFLYSALTPDKAVETAKRLGYRSVGISDIGGMSGYAPFYHAAEKAGIKPYFGMDAATELGPFSFYALNEQGYRNLLYLYRLAQKGQVAVSALNGHYGGLAAIFDGENCRFRSDGFAKENGYIRKLAAFMGNFAFHYIGIPYLPDEKGYVERLREFAAGHSYKAVAFDTVAYAKPADAEALEILRAVSEDRHLTRKSGETAGRQYMFSPNEAESYFRKGEIESLEEIEGANSFVYLVKRGELLHFPLPEGEKSADECLRKLARVGLEKKKPGYGKEYADRLDYELSVISEMGYSDYFLIVADYVGFAKENGISVGPGRGSSGGSLVAYALDIVECDPLRYGLIFERFLNPERTSMPDIDCDFSDVRRGEVISYLRRKYGENRVAHVLTTVNIGARQALRDVARVYGFSEQDTSLLSSSIDEKMGLRDNYRRSAKFRQYVDAEPSYAEFAGLACKIEGLPRQAGLHAAGVIIDQNDLSSLLPLKEDESEGSVACLEKDYLEEQGFLKMDILGIRNLSMIDLCLDLYAKHTGRRLKQSEIPYDDEESLKDIVLGYTSGIFQLESGGMRNAILQVKPGTFEELAMMIALYRPGPMAQIPSFARRKAGLEKVTYISPELEPILKETYGIIIYQEQVMAIAVAYAGFSAAKADLFRRAISKKDEAKLLSLRQSFYEGAARLGHPERETESVYGLILRFASYGFNKSHAVSYAALAGRMAYLKKHMPGEFYSAVMNSYGVKDPKFRLALREAKSKGLSLHCPDVNVSGYTMENIGDRLYLPLSYIGGLANNLSNDIVGEREERGPYADIFDLAKRCRKYGLKLTALVSLIDAGALDCFGLSRATLRGAAPGADAYAAMLVGEDGKSALLDMGLPPPLVEERQEDVETAYREEKAALGILVSGSMFHQYGDRLSAAGAKTLSETLREKGNYLTRGIVTRLSRTTTKRGESMGFLDVADDTDEASFALFPEAYLRYSGILKEGKALLIEAKNEDYRGKVSRIISSVKEL